MPGTSYLSVTVPREPKGDRAVRRSWGPGRQEERFGKSEEAGEIHGEIHSAL